MLVHDQSSGALLRRYQNLHSGCVAAVEGCQSGRLLFSGGHDGLVMWHDLRMKRPSAVTWHHNAGALLSAPLLLLLFIVVGMAVRAPLLLLRFCRLLSAWRCCGYSAVKLLPRYPCSLQRQQDAALLHANASCLPTALHPCCALLRRAPFTCSH